MSEDLVKFFKALGEETRLQIVQYILPHNYCACEFAPMTGKDQTTVSRHLKILTDAGILKCEKNGRNIIYSIKNDEVKEMLINMGINPIQSCCGGNRHERK